MNISKILKEHNIKLSNFELAYFIPVIKFKNGKSEVEAFEMKFEEKKDEY